MRSTSPIRPVMPCRAQAGSTLLEGMIAVLLMAIVGLGVTYSLSRVALAQSTLNAQNSVIGQLRSGLQSISVSNSFATATPTSTLCTTSLGGNLNLNATAAVTNQSTCTLSRVSVTVAGGSVTSTSQLPQIANSVNDSKLGGTLTVGN